MHSVRRVLSQLCSRKCTVPVAKQPWHGVRCFGTASSPGDLLGMALPDNVMTYTEEDVILYNLAVGASLSSGHTDVYRYIYENDASFCVLPTFATRFVNRLKDEIFTDKFPLQLNFRQLYMAEHFVKLHKPLDPKGGKVTNKTKIVDVLESGKCSAFIIEVDSFDDTNTLVAHNQTLLYTTQYRGWGGKLQSDRVVKLGPAPNRKPDITVTEKTAVDQAALYRLTGDTNPYTIDPMLAASIGFPRPFLHMLCTFGFTVRSIIDKFCDNEPALVDSTKMTLSTHVLPGQSLQIDMWREGTRVHFTTCVAETGTVSIGGYVDLKQ